MSFQKWIKWKSERAIINALNEGDRSFSELIDLTDLSKPVLSQRLKELERAGKIESVPEMKTKRFLYHLNHEALDTIDELHIKLHIVSKIIVYYLANFARDSSISDEEYVTKLEKGLYWLFDFRMMAYRVSPSDVQKEWLKTTLGLEFVSSLSDLFPENREILEYLTKDKPSKELSILKARDAEKAAKQLIEFLDKIIEKTTRK